MTKAIEAGIPKLRIEEAAAKTQARIDAGVQSVIGVNKYPPTRRSADRRARRSTTPPCAQMQLDKLKRLRAERDPAALKEALDALTRAAERQRQSAGARGRRGARQGHRRRDLDGAGEGVRPPCRLDQSDHRCLQAGGRHDRRGRAGARAGRSVRGGRRPPPAPAGRQDRPGRPRPRPEGDRFGLRRSRLRRRYRAAVCDAGRSRAPGGGERRAHSRRVVARRRASDAGAGAEDANWRSRAATTS